jgi:hypothetical protein
MEAFTVAVDGLEGQERTGQLRKPMGERGVGGPFLSEMKVLEGGHEIGNHPRALLTPPALGLL